MKQRALYGVDCMIVMLSCAMASQGQDQLNEYSEGRSDTLKLRFERHINTLTWTGATVVRHSEGPFNIEVDQRAKDRLLRVIGSPRQSEYNGHVNVLGALSGPWSVVLRESSSVLSGPSGIDLDAVTQHSLLAGPSVEVTPWLSLRGLAGWVWNRQLSRESNGVRWTMEGEVPTIDWESLQISGSGRWDRSDLNDRQPHDVDGNLSVARRFGEAAGDSLFVSYRNRRRDLLTGGTGDFLGGTATIAGLLKRSEEVVAIRNSLWFSSGPDLRGMIDGGWSGRTIGRSMTYQGSVPSSVQQVLPTSITQLTLDIAGRVHWAPWNRMTSEFSTGVATSEERHDVEPEADDVTSLVDQQRAQARRRSNQAHRMFAGLKIGSSIDDATHLTFIGSANILRYDTPDTLNTDDRDDLLLSASAEVEHTWSRDVTLVAALEGGLNHLVYLSRYQSANNVRIRTLRFSPGIIWTRPGGFRNAMRAEVAASYTVYDFEDQIGSVQSYSYRQASWSDSLLMPIGATLELEFNGSLRLFERGLLNWHEFRERLERSFVEIAWWPSVALRPLPGFRLSVGFRGFLQERYVYRAGTRTYDGALGSSGPTVTLEMVDNRSGTVHLVGWRESQRVNGRPVVAVSNLSLSVNMLL